jgi:DNA-3-methyladenine glycosylase II
LAAAFDPFDPEAILRARPPRLARLGLSAAKIRTLKAIARAVIYGALPLAALAELAAEEAHATLTAVHGIGPWTADIYLVSCLGHADAWPAGDLALQEATKVAFALPARPSAKEMLALAETWRPWRAVAARILWSYYRAAVEAAKASAKASSPATRQTSSRGAASPTKGPRKARRKPAGPKRSQKKVKNKTR